MSARTITSVRESPPARLQAFVWVCLVTAAFLLAHGYFGFVHDNILYLAQALARLQPDVYLGDIYLAWGSQDRYTAFSPIYAWLIANFGLQGANMTLVILAQVLFLTSSFVFLRTWHPPGSRGLAMLFIAVSNGLYGSGFIFRMAEQFATPRPFVEAGTLFAAALLLSGRRAAAFALIVLCGFLHPLVALAAFLFAWIYLVIEDRRWLWLAALAVLPIAAALGGITPFEQMLRSFDQEWLSQLLSGNQHVFVTEWMIYDWSLVAWDLSVLYMAMRLFEGRLRRLSLAGLALAVVSLAMSAIGADLLRNVLVTNLQIWRAMWLVHWLALAFLPIVLMHLSKGTAGGRLAAGIALFGFFLRGLPAGLIASLVAIAVFAGRNDLVMRQWLLKAALGALGAGAFLHWAAIALKARDRLLDQSLTPGVDYAIEALTKPLPLAVIAAAVIALLVRVRYRQLAAVVSLALLVAAVLVWDRRSPLKRYAETTPLGAHPFSGIVKPDQEVYWYEQPELPWVLMQRRSYVSGAQAAGQMFNRDTAMQLAKRRLEMNPLEFQEQFCQFMNKGNNREDSCVEDVDMLQETCRDAPGLGFIVLATRRGSAAIATWTPPVEYAAYRPTYYLYACKQLAGR